MITCDVNGKSEGSCQTCPAGFDMYGEYQPVTTFSIAFSDEKNVVLVRLCANCMKTAADKIGAFVRAMEL